MKSRVLVNIIIISMIKIVCNIVLPFTAWIPLGFLMYCIISKPTCKEHKVYVLCSIFIMSFAFFILYQEMIWTTSVLLFITFLIQAFDEEFIFRFMVVKEHESMSCTLISLYSIVFSLLHVSDFFHLSNQYIVIFMIRFCFSFLLFLIYEKTKSITLNTSIHLLNNSFTMTSLNNSSIYILFVMFLFVLFLYKREVCKKIIELKENC